jgi:hypothetical protein
MKKMIFAALLAVLSISAIAQARWFGRGNGNGCCAPTCAPACPQPECPPTCHKTIMVPQTIQVPKVVEVPARRIVIPQPDICIRIPQPAKMIRIPQPPIPQPDCIKWECQPDRIEYRKQPALVRFECPPDSDESCNRCAPSCAPGC